MVESRPYSFFHVQSQLLSFGPGEHHYEGPVDAHTWQKQKHANNVKLEPHVR